MNVRAMKGDKILISSINGECIYPRDREFIHDFLKTLSDNGYTLINKTKILADLDKCVLLFEDNDMTLVRIAHGKLLRANGVTIDMILTLILDVLTGKIDDIKQSPLNNLLYVEILGSEVTDLESFLLIDSYESTKQIKELKNSILE